MLKTFLKSESGKILKGLLLIQPKIFKDERGLFFESWNQKKFNELTSNPIQFVQDNRSQSSKGVLRGLHYQIAPHAQGKLVSCTRGEIFDIAVDIRMKSETFGEWAGVYLDSNIHQQLWIPEGFAHGFLTLSDSADVLYKTTNFWHAESERIIRWDDKDINIKWPKTKIAPNLSDKDSKASFLSEIKTQYLF
tara:strand:+ start:1530 stop:2105 length:576 start_codon:yes stop_codon:yes gene_type:complete